MPKKVDLKELKARIKANKVILKKAKKIVMNEMTQAINCEIYDVSVARNAFNECMKTAKALKKDTDTLYDSLNSGDE